MTAARERLAMLVEEHLGVEPSRILDDVTFERLDADSLDMVELVMSLEEDLKISIDDDEANKHLSVDNTFGEAAAFVATKLDAVNTASAAVVHDDRPERDSIPRSHRGEGRNFID